MKINQAMEISQVMESTKEAYDIAQGYVKYADGDLEEDLFSFQKKDNLWCYHDTKTWEYIKGKLAKANISSVLDVGCGSGAWAFRIAATFPNVEVKGIDFSPAQISRAKRILRSHEELTDRVKFAVGDATDLEYEEGEFDVSICLHDVLNHIPDYHVALDEMARVTSEFNITSVHGFYAPETCFVMEKERVVSYEKDGDMVHLVDVDGKSYDVYCHLFKAGELAKEFNGYFNVVEQAGINLRGEVCREKFFIDFSDHIIIYSHPK